MSETVYVAGPYRARSALKRCATQVAAAGYTVQARWLDGHVGPPGAALEAPLHDRQRWAREDCQDVTACSLLIAFTAREAYRLTHDRAAQDEDLYQFGASGGRHVETGYAIGTGRTVLLVGEPENVFHWLPQVRRVQDWSAARTWLAEHAAEAQERAS